MNTCPKCGSEQNANEMELEYHCGSTATHQSTRCFDREDLFQRVKALEAYAARLERNAAVPTHPNFGRGK